MARTDRQGRDLQTFIAAEITGAPVEARELIEATGLTPAKYYGRGNGRGSAEDFPNPVELGCVADHYSMGKMGFANLLAEFDYLDIDEAHPGISGGTLLTRRVAAPARARSRRQTQLEIAQSRPPLG